MKAPRIAGGSAILLGSDFKSLAAARSLSRLGVRVAVVDSDPRSAWYSRHVSTRIRWHARLDDPALVDSLLAAAWEHRLFGAVIFPMQDDAVELVSRQHRRLSTTFLLTTPPWDRLRHAHQKTLLYRAADRAGVDHPATWQPAGEEEISRLPIRFPAIVKPAVSTALVNSIHRKALLASDLAALREHYRAALQHVTPGDLMIQEFVPGGGEQQYSYCALVDDGQVLAGFTARRLRQYPIDFGMSSSFVEAVDVPQLDSPSRRLLWVLRYTGIVELEYKQHATSGRFQLLDANARAWAWHGLCAAAGVDFIDLEYRRVTGAAMPVLKPRRSIRWRRLLTDVPAGVALIRSGKVGLGSYLRSLRGATAYSVFDPRDPLPAVLDLPVALSRVVRRKPTAARALRERVGAVPGAPQAG